MTEDVRQAVEQVASEDLMFLARCADMEGLHGVAAKLRAGYSLDHAVEVAELEVSPINLFGRQS